MLLKGKEVSPLTNWPLHTDSSSKALDMWNFKYSTPEYTCHFFQLSFSLQPKIWINVYFTTTKVTVVMKVKPMVMLMKEIMMAAIKLTALIMKVVEKKRRKRCCVSSWDAQPIVKTWPALQHLPLSASSSRGLYAEGPSEYSFPPTLFNLLPLIGPHQSWKSSALWGLGPLTLNMWFCGSGHRHLLTHSVEIRHCLQLGISETIVTNKKLVAEWKLCILSQWSCRNITVPDKVLGRILAA